MPPDDPDPGREDSIPTPPDPRRETRRSPLETTKKHPAFDDPRSPDASPQSLLIGELHAVLDAFREEQRREAASLRSYIRSTTDETLASHELSRRHIVHLAGLTGEVWREVFGAGRPPPSPPPGSDQEIRAALTPLDTASRPPSSDAMSTGKRGKVSEHDVSIDAIMGHVLALQDSVATLQPMVEETHHLQREQMGKRDPADHRKRSRRLKDGILWMIRERDGQRFALALIAALVPLVSALGASYAVARGRVVLPAPAATATARGER